VSRAYYNEINPYAAQWLRNLIAAGHIAPGDVDERSIEDVRPADLVGYTQCHFFAGIGIWSASLRAAGWSDDRPVWTGSCPCQPFSTAGKGEGFDDERHLWPAWFHLVRVCRPATVFGEQVANGDGIAWVDLVHRDMEGEGYAIGAADLCAAGWGAPHIRQRLYFVAHAHGDELRWSGGRDGHHREAGGAGQEARLRPCADLRDGGEAGDVANTAIERFDRGRSSEESKWQLQPERLCDAGELVHPERAGLEGHPRHGDHRDEPGRIAAAAIRSASEAGATRGFWANAEWIPCRHPSKPEEVEWRPVEPGTFPLVDGAAFRLGSGGTHEGKSRQGMLHGYGNGIVKPVATGFVRAAMECLPSAS